MNTDKIKQTIPALAVIIFLSLTTFPVFAQSVSPTINLKKTTTQQIHLQDLIGRGDQAITQRITSLNNAITKIQNAKRLTDSQKSSLISRYQSVIDALNTLKIKIDGDTDLTIVKNDVRSIYTQYRVYMLVLPQSAIVAAADRIEDGVLNLQAFVTKLQSRISANQSKGKDVSGLQTSLTELQSKLSDAQTQAQNALTLVSSLTPDEGNQSKISSNNQALLTARQDIKTGLEDLKTAFTEAKSILASLKTLNSN